MNTSKLSVKEMEAVVDVMQLKPEKNIIRVIKETKQFCMPTGIGLIICSILALVLWSGVSRISTKKGLILRKSSFNGKVHVNILNSLTLL